MIKRILAVAALAWAFAAHGAAGDYVDRSGTVDTGGASQTLVEANPSRGNIAVHNLSTESEVLCINTTSAASCSAAGSIHIQPGDTVVLTTKEVITVTAATTGHKFTAKENVVDGFVGSRPAGGAGGGGAATVADGADVAMGAKADAACATDNGTCSLIALVKRWLQRFTTFLASMFSSTASTDAARVPVSTRIIGTVQTGTSDEAENTIAPFAPGENAASVIVQLTANTATANFEFSNDGGTTYLAAQCVAHSNNGSSSLVSTSTTTGAWYCPNRGALFRVRQTGAGGITAYAYASASPPPVMTPVNIGGGSVTITGVAAEDAAASGNPPMVGLHAHNARKTAMSTSGDVVRALATMEGVQVTRPYSIPETEWNYAAAASGIANTTTAVTFKAADATFRHYVTSIDLMCEALTNATEVAIRDGAGGTVLWRTKVSTAGLTDGRHIRFPNPLRGSAATLLEVVTLTASGAGACYFNASGYTAP